MDELDPSLADDQKSPVPDYFVTDTSQYIDPDPDNDRPTKMLLCVVYNWTEQLLAGTAAGVPRSDAEQLQYKLLHAILDYSVDSSYDRGQAGTALRGKLPQSWWEYPNEGEAGFIWPTDIAVRGIKPFPNPKQYAFRFLGFYYGQSVGPTGCPDRIVVL